MKNTLFTRLSAAWIMLLLVNTGVALGQPSARQLEQVRKAGRTSAAVELLNDISSECDDQGDWRRSRQYGYKALALAKKIGYRRGIARSYMNLGISYMYRNDREALEMLRLSLKKYQELGDKPNMANAFVNIGSVYDNLSDYANALKCYAYAIRYAKRVGDIDLEAAACLNAGIAYYAIGDLTSALKMEYRALKLYDRLGQTASSADVRNCLGNVYSDQGNDSMALHMYYSSIRLAKRVGDELGVANARINIALVYTSQEKFDAALAMNGKAMHYFERVGNHEGRSIAYNNLATVYYNEGSYAKALEMCDRAKAASDAGGDLEEAANANVIRAQVYIRTGELDRARQLLLHSLQTNESIGHKQLAVTVYEVWMELDSVSNDYRSALRHYKLWKAYADSIDSEQARRKGYQLSLKYDFDKKTLEQKRRHDNDLAALRTQNRLSSQRQQFLGIMLALVVLAAFVVWLFARRAGIARRKYYAVLANENEHKEALLQEVHHRVNNSLQMISSLLAIQADTAANPEVTEYLLKSENRIQALSVMHRLLHQGNSRLEVNIRDYLGSVLDFYSDLLESRPGIRLRVTLPDARFHTKAAMPLGLILNELITNTLKHAFPEHNGTIAVSLEKAAGENWVFSFLDDGVGFAQDRPGDIGSGIGWQLIRLMARQLNGQLTLSGENGTAVTVTFTHTGPTSFLPLQ